MEQDKSDQGNTPAHNRVSLLGFPLDVGLTTEHVVNRIAAAPLLLSYLNPYAWYVARHNQDYQRLLGKFDLVVCDGIGVQHAVKHLLRISTDVISLDISDSGIAQGYLDLWSDSGSELCLVGGNTDHSVAAKKSLGSAFPHAGRLTAFSGYENGPQQAEDHILEKQPAMVLAGMGMGLQEAFLLGLRDKGYRGTGIAVGGFIDKLANPELKYPAWSERMNMRFLGRISSEPRKFIKRYTMDYMPFMSIYLKHLLGPGTDHGVQ